MADFNKTYALTNTAEGGYANRGAADKGGETYQGIARNFNPNWAGWPIIDAYKAIHGPIPQDANPSELKNNAQLQALHKSFAHDQFWNAIKGDQIPDQHLADLMFTILWGNGTSKVTQQAVNDLSPIKVVVDGVIGQDTLAKILALPQDKFYETLKQRQADYYRKIAYGGNLQGWLNRLNTFPDHILAAAKATATAAETAQEVSDIADHPLETAKQIISDPIGAAKKK